MSKDLENDFFYRLRLITTLLIKQASPEYRELMPLVKEYEDGHWDALDLNEKYQRLDLSLIHI